MTAERRHAQSPPQASVTANRQPRPIIAASVRNRIHDVDRQLRPITTNNNPQQKPTTNINTQQTTTTHNNQQQLSDDAAMSPSPKRLRRSLRDPSPKRQRRSPRLNAGSTLAAPLPRRSRRGNPPLSPVPSSPPAPSSPDLAPSQCSYDKIEQGYLSG